jgi:mRNA interferase RelE/StbE
MPYTVSIKPKAERYLGTLRDARLYRRLRDAIDGLADDPRPAGCRKMKGEENLYRIRLGEHRILYDIQDAVLVVLVVQVGHRREIYRS